MLQKRILVPFGAFAKDLKGIHYALALAERLGAEVHILQEEVRPGTDNFRSAWLQEALLDLINDARLADITVSQHLANGALEEELLNLVKQERVDMIVCGAEDGISEGCLQQIKPLVAGQIIKVKGREES